MQWPFPYHDMRNTSFNPDATVRTKPEKQWQVEIPGFKHPPIVHDETVALCIDTTGGPIVTGFDRKTGERCWTQHQTELSSPFVIGNSIGYVDEGDVKLIDPSTGSLTRRYRLCDEAYNATTDGDSLFVAGDVLSCIDLGSDERVWCTTANTKGSLVLGTDVLYIAYDNTMAAVDKTTGDLLWNHEADRAISRPTEDGDHVYVTTSFGGIVSALNPVTGDEQWSFDTGTWVEGTVATDDEHVYIGGTNAHLIALDQTDGSVEWAFETDSDADTSPVVTGDTVVVPTVEGHLYGVDRTAGTLRWQVELEREPYGPAIVGEELYVATISSVSLFRS